MHPPLPQNIYSVSPLFYSPYLFPTNSLFIINAPIFCHWFMLKMLILLRLFCLRRWCWWRYISWSISFESQGQLDEEVRKVGFIKQWKGHDLGGTVMSDDGKVSLPYNPLPPIFYSIFFFLSFVPFPRFILFPLVHFPSFDSFFSLFKLQFSN